MIDDVLFYFKKFIFIILMILFAEGFCLTGCTQGPGPENSTDADNDGIHDSVEADLLKRFSPYYLFDDGENFRPSDVLWYIRNSELLPSGDEQSTPIYTKDQLSGNPWLLLMATDASNHNRFCSQDANDNWNCQSSLLTNPRETMYHLNVYNEYRRGNTWDEVLRDRNTGLYGHVTCACKDYKPGSPPPPVNECPLYMVEYWQFYPYNSVGQVDDLYDHEAEWETVQLLIDPASYDIVSVFHYVHGKPIRFDMSCNPATSPINSPFEAMEYRGPLYSASYSLQVSSKTNNNILRLGYDDTAKKYTHPLVYIEHGTHAMWPSEFWEICEASIFCTRSHAGKGYYYKTNSGGRNLGEVDYPLNEVSGADLILQYNGKWGAYSKDLDSLGFATNSPPPGPELHKEFNWPVSSKIGKLINERYDVTVQTGNKEDAGTSARVYIKFSGSNGTSKGDHLNSSGNDFEIGNKDTYPISIFRTGELGDLQKVQIWHDNTDDKPGWFLDELWVEYKWRNNTYRSWYFPCFDWLKDNDLMKTLYPGKKYDITVHTGNIDDAGTSAKVYIQLYGSNGNSKEYLLDLIGNDFERNNTDTFPFGCQDLGTLQKLTIRHDNTGDQPGWFLDQIWVKDIETGTIRTFSGKCWLTGDQNMKTLYPQ